MNDANSHDIRSELPTQPLADIQARPSVARGQAPVRRPEYRIRKRPWKLWLSLAFLCVALLAAGVYSLVPPVDPRASWPPLTAAEARQALVEFAASGDPGFAQFGYGLGPIPEQPEEPEPWARPEEVIFGHAAAI
jgi:hypothetical protein